MVTLFTDTIGGLTYDEWVAVASSTHSTILLHRLPIDHDADVELWRILMHLCIENDWVDGFRVFFEHFDDESPLEALQGQEVQATYRIQEYLREMCVGRECPLMEECENSVFHRSTSQCQKRMLQ
jgi:hypothetical protein